MGLFEAIGLSDRVLVWDTPKSKFYYPNHPFESFVDANDLLEKIKDSRVGFIDFHSIHSVWAKDWKKNYKNFLMQFIDESNLEDNK